MKRLSQCLVKLGVAAANRSQAVKEAGRLLVDSGCVTPRYVDAVSQNYGEEVCMVIAPWLAVVHLRDPELVKKNGVGVLTLKKPVRFGFEASESVRLVVALAAQDTVEHLSQIDEVGTLLSCPGQMERLCRAENEEQVRKILNWR